MCLPGLMRISAGRGVLLAMLLAAAGCSHAGEPYVVPETPMPANTVLLAQMMRELSDRPGFTEALLGHINEGTKKGPAFLTPALVDRLRELIVGKDWQGLDRFPGWTMRTINPTLRVVGNVVGKDEKAEDLATRNSDAPSSAETIKQFLDIGTYSADKAEVVSLDTPSTLPGFSLDGLTAELGAGVVRGDGPNLDLAPLHAESQRLADILNRLSLNKPIKPADGARRFEAIAGGRAESSPEGLIQALVANGHTVEVWDARYFANFGHFHYKGKDVMMPFWVDPQIQVPGTNRPLLVPVSHAEYEWKVRGPKVNANVSWYFGIDGKAEFRTMDTQDQPWVMVRHAHTYIGADAVEVTRLTGRMVVAYVHQHQARPALPFGGYYALGVCQDGVAAIEKKMTGKATLFPNTADVALFDDARDAEVNELIAAIPKDRNGRLPEPERIFGSLPTEDLASVSIPGFGADLVLVHKAWQQGHLKRPRGRRHTIVVWLATLGIVLGLCVVGALVRRRMQTA
jgi:hypothetical protein